jgi:hypothetical protein
MIAGVKSLQELSPKLRQDAREVAEMLVFRRFSVGRSALWVWRQWVEVWERVEEGVEYPSMSDSVRRDRVSLHG